jgi:hypothetical protein
MYLSTLKIYTFGIFKDTDEEIDRWQRASSGIFSSDTSACHITQLIQPKCNGCVQFQQSLSSPTCMARIWYLVKVLFLKSLRNATKSQSVQQVSLLTYEPDA